MLQSACRPASIPPGTSPVRSLPPQRQQSIQAHSASRTTIPQPGTSRGSAARSSTTSSSTTSLQLGKQSNAAASPPVPSSTPLDNSYQNLNPAGQVAVHWRHFTAFTTIGEKEASILVFDKQNNVKAPARLGRINRLGLIDLLRFDVSQIVQLAHPRILRTLHPLAENKEMICFACEPIYGSLDRLIGENGICLDRLEIKLGILQIIEGLSYLHNSAKILHGNLTPSAIFVTSQHLWKIGSFAFSVAGKKPNCFPCFPWTKRLPVSLQPDLDFLAPEYLEPNNHTVSTAADVFSLGVLICWICGNGKRLIDVHNNLESYQIVIDQLDVALNQLDDELGSNLKSSLNKVLSKDTEQRPAVQLLALIKHFDDPPLAALRQLDDIAQEFDPAHKAIFLSHTLLSALPNIPEPLWFSRILQRFNEYLVDSQELYPALLRPLTHMLNHCESHNIHKLRPWLRRILERGQEKALSQGILDNMSVIFRRLTDEQVEDACFDLLIFLLSGQDPHLKQTALRTIPQIVDFIPLWFINKKLIPLFQAQANFFEGHIPRQIDLLVAVAHLSDRCDIATLHYLLTVASICNALHPAIVHSKSRLVQRILTYDVSRLQDPLVVAHHLLNPLVLGLALPELSPAHFDDTLSSTRILLDIIEQLRYESDDKQRTNENGCRRLCNRRVSMSSNHLPRLLITAARPSFGGDGRKMSFLSADGRLEDRGSRRESKDSRCSLESDVSLRIGNGSDISDESALHSGGSARQVRRKSWLEGYMHSVSLEQSSLSQTEPKQVERTYRHAPCGKHSIKTIRNINLRL
ncbi:protein kinase domain-containing protein [Ditylenchus destructor]|uniref:Protein kinase domain-containing protein n=1 Tax=Ditylenchus destructor TaxID=166010 RepID=A0AAD4NHN1_9BILA|nr:protein kinase domain-containing protein [Ditylenchus destructor]